jgi:hypothetical protein
VLEAWETRGYQAWISKQTSELIATDFNEPLQGMQSDQVDLRSCLSIMRTQRQYERTHGKSKRYR